MNVKNHFRNKKNEDDPLLDDDQIIFERTAHGSALQFDNPIFEEDDVSIAERPLEEIREQMKIREESHPERRLMILDVVYHVIEYFQFYALLQSLSLRWTWPLSWTSSLSFMFLFNLDLWEFLKISSGAYVAARDYIVPSSDVPLAYRWWFAGWMILLLAIACAFLIARLYLRRREISKAISAGTMLQKIIVGVVQILSLPLGVQLGKVFWCNPGTDVMNVANEVQCWSTEHIVYVVISLIVLLLVFPLYALKLYLQIKSQVVTFKQRRHEAFLQLKDCEYRFGLGTAWSSRMFIIFASYRRRWVYARPIVHLIKFVVICFYAGLFNFRLPQISVIAAIFFVQIFLCLFPRQYRVSSFNALAFWCWAALCGNAVTGVLLNIDGLESAFTTPDYVQGELLLANLGWLLGVLAWLVYILLRAKGVICANTPLWPSMMSRELQKLPENTKRYMLAALQARFTIQRASIVPPLLSPVHELAHHIHIVNALACEAEYLRDPLHSSLRDTLDDLIELHGRISPQSLFSESLKPSVHSTVHELLKVLPDFTRRLKQREYDFILTSPVRRRLLLKIFVVSCFLSKSRREGDATGGEAGRGGPSAALRRLWKPPSADSNMAKEDDISDEGFVGDDEGENDSFQDEMWYEEDVKQASVVISPDPEKEESVI